MNLITALSLRMKISEIAVKRTNVCKLNKENYLKSIVEIQIAKDVNLIIAAIVTEISAFYIKNTINVHFYSNIDNTKP